MEGGCGLNQLAPRYHALMLTVDISQWLIDTQSFKLFSLTQNLIRKEKHRMKKLQLSGYSRTSQNISFKILCLDMVLYLVCLCNVMLLQLL